MAEGKENIPVVEEVVKTTHREQNSLDNAEAADAKVLYDKNVQRDMQNRLDYLIKETQIYDHFVTNSKSRREGEKSTVTNNNVTSGASRQKVDPKSVMQFKSTPDYIKNGEMRDYQVAGLNWMITIYENGISGILADEMGLGKTLQTIAFIGYLKFKKGLSSRLKYLVIVPASTVQNWLNEFERWCPSLKVVALNGYKEKRKEIKKQIKSEKWDVMITTYQMTYIDGNTIRQHRYHTVILDEGHRIKNEKTLTAIEVRKITTNNRMILTGTPIHNTVHELWALMNFLMPDIFNSGDDFDQWFQDMECINNTAIIDRLRAIIKPFMLRRIKADVEKSLKAKDELKIYVGMSNLQVEWYRKLLLKEVYTLDSKGFMSKMRLENMLMHLRKCTNHPYIFREAEEGPPYVAGEHLIENSGKMVIMDKLLARFKAEGSRVLIFSQMTRMLDIIEDYCQYRGHTYCRLDGDLNTDERNVQIDDFTRSDSDKFLFLLSTRAGGLGINLAVADIVIIYDCDFNPQMDLQAMDRAHRIGQTKQVRVFKLVVEKSVDERIVEYSEMKQMLDQKLINNKKTAPKDIMKTIVSMDVNMHLEGRAVRLEDEDLDTILARCRQRDKENEAIKQDQVVLQHKYESIYKFEGEDFKEKQEQKIQQKRMEELAIPRWTRRARVNSKYGVKSLPTYMQEYHPFWFFSTRLMNYIKQEKLYSMKAQQKPARSQDEDNEILLASPLTHSEREDYEELLKDSFKDWTNANFRNFIRASARYGRDNIEEISTHVPTIPPDVVKRYHAVFWDRYTELPQYEILLKEIEDGEKPPENRKRPLEDTKTTEVSPNKKAKENIPTIIID